MKKADYDHSTMVNAKAEYFSQHGEDRILTWLFPRPVGCCVDVGAHDGMTFSNTYRLEQLGWRCVLVEPAPHLCDRIRKRRPNAFLFECAASNADGTATLQIAEGYDVYSSIESRMPCAETVEATKAITRKISVKTRKLDDILIEAGLNDRIDFISIDVEGHELHALEGLSIERWRPRVAIIEDMAGDVSNTSVQRYMAAHGYVRFYRSGVNDWYAAPGEFRLRSLFFLLFSGKWGAKGLSRVWLPITIRKRLIAIYRRTRYRSGRNVRQLSRKR